MIFSPVTPFSLLIFPYFFKENSTSKWNKGKGKGKGKLHPRTGYEGPEGE
jgi:hypothetical protein